MLVNVRIIIPHFNRWSNLRELLVDLAAQVDCECETVIVDDCSVIDESKEIKSLFPHVTIHRNSTNIGPSKSRNLGARDAETPYLLFLDSDVRIPDRRTISEIVQVLQAHKDIHLLALRIRDRTGLSDDSKRWWHPVPLDKYNDQWFFSNYFSGTAFCVRNEMFIRSGQFPEDVFMGSEENDLAYRLLKVDGNIVYCPVISVNHNEGPDAGRSRRSVIFKTRNQLLLAIEHFSYGELLCFVAPRIVKAVIVAIISGHSKMFLWNLLNGIKQIPNRYSRRTPLSKTQRARLLKIKAGLCYESDTSNQKGAS